jgi:hypothetical protein
MTTAKQFLSRRPVLAGLAAVAVAAVAGIGVDLLQPKHKGATGPDADLVNTLDDPESAATIGTAILARAPDKRVAIHEARAFAHDRLQHDKLIDVLTVDANAGFVTEANGWVLPITLGALCILAAQ